MLYNVDFTTLSGNYSMTEQDTGFTWVDGKKIYKKTIKRASGISTGQFNVSHGISNLATVVKAEILASSGDGSTNLTPAMVNTSGGNYWAPWSVSSTVVEFYSNVSSPRALYITLYYTKTS